MSSDPLLRFTLPDGRPATLLLGEASTVLSIDDLLVSSWDLAGRPYALVRETGTYRRGLDGGLLRKREATVDAPRVRERLSPAAGALVVESVRREAGAALEALAPSAPADARDRLRAIVALTGDALAEDAARFVSASGRVGILPPDQYLSLVVRLTEGCSWNACTFCGLYRDVPFRARTQAEVARHLDALLQYMGPSLALRRSVFLGDANALCLATHRLLPLLATVAERLPGRPQSSFVDAWTGARRSEGEWRECARLGLRRVYVGLESGDPGLLAWLEKPGTPGSAIDLVRALHGAGLQAGVIVLLGAGGTRFDEAHVAGTTHALQAMDLGPRDIVYLSDFVADPRLPHAARAAQAPDLRPLDAGATRAQRDRLAAALRQSGARARVATYDLREFVY